MLFIFLCKTQLQIPPPVPSRSPTILKHAYVPPKAGQIKKPPPIPPVPRSRGLPPVPPARNLSDGPHKRVEIKPRHQSHHTLNKQLPVNSSFEFSQNGHESNRLPPQPSGPPQAVAKPSYKPSISPATKVPVSSQCNNTKVSMRQDSGVSSDSFSQTFSPSYTTKTMEIPLLPPKTPIKQNGVLAKIGHLEDGSNNTTITKSASTPAGLQTIVKFHNGSNMSLHHKVC